MNFAVLEPPVKVFSTKFGYAIPTYDRFQHSTKILLMKWSLLPIHESFLPQKFPAIQYYCTPYLENVQQELYNSTSKYTTINHRTCTCTCTYTRPVVLYTRPVVLYTLDQWFSTHYASGSLHTTPDQWFSTHYARPVVLYTSKYMDLPVYLMNSKHKYFMTNS